jgi:hypothetical protein
MIPPLPSPIAPMAVATATIATTAAACPVAVRSASTSSYVATLSIDAPIIRCTSDPRVTSAMPSSALWGMK